MPYTIQPKERHAKVFGSNVRISSKKAKIICRVIRGKKLRVVKRLLSDLLQRRRDLDGMYYTKTVAEILNLLKSCEKNADSKNLDKGKLFVHASAHQGTITRRRRRKSGFGSRMKMANVEIFLIERGKEEKTSVHAKKEATHKADVTKHHSASEVKSDIQGETQ